MVSNDEASCLTTEVNMSWPRAENGVPNAGVDTVRSNKDIGVFAAVVGEIDPSPTLFESNRSDGAVEANVYLDRYVMEQHSSQVVSRQNQDLIAQDGSEFKESEAYDLVQHEVDPRYSREPAGDGIQLAGQPHLILKLSVSNEELDHASFAGVPAWLDHQDVPTSTTKPPSSAQSCNSGTVYDCSHPLGFAL
jgi:hypothetical protein